MESLYGVVCYDETLAGPVLDSLWVKEDDADARVVELETAGERAVGVVVIAPAKAR